MEASHNDIYSEACSFLTSMLEGVYEVPANGLFRMVFDKILSPARTKIALTKILIGNNTRSFINYPLSNTFILFG